MLPRSEDRESLVQPRWNRKDSAPKHCSGDRTVAALRAKSRGACTPAA